ncbi:glycine cleavage system T protein, partial [Trichodelitschia bisporula]
SEEELLKTPLYDLHIVKGGKIVPFGGFSMPVYYEDLNITESHNWTREKASLFDVSHMLQHNFAGPGAANFLASITPSSPKALAPFTSTLSAFLHPDGGIVDDTIITNISSGWRDQFYVVTNGACRAKDKAFISDALAAWRRDSQHGEVSWHTLENNGLIALQGPLAAEILQSLEPKKDGHELDLSTLHFGQSAWLTFGDVLSGEDKSACLVSRGGYTGEDGFEISITGSDHSNPTQTLTEALLRYAGPEKLRLAGLGPRDSLRLEAGMCLYGHDIDDTTTPVEAGLSWIVAKDRRAQGGFNGSDTILQQLKAKKDGGGVTRRRVGIVVEDRAPAREGAKIVNEEGEEVGVVTSGGPSPTLGKNIAMGYIRDGLHKTGTKVGVVVRNKTRPAVVTKMPFVPTKYWKGKGAA